MKVSISYPDQGFDSYRANRVKSLFNAERSNFSLEADLPVEGLDWKVGLIVGSSGSGKTSIGKSLFPGVEIKNLYEGWPDSKPIVDVIDPEGSFDSVTGLLAAVGLGDVPSWLKSFKTLSNGQQFRAGLARELAGSDPVFIIDEFTSVIDRQIAKIGALAFGKSMRRQPRQCVLLSCHYDVIEWLQPDWVYDTDTGRFLGKSRSGGDLKSSFKSTRFPALTGSYLRSITI
ncbi:MAG: hypothetical protein ABJG41_10075 [Cyclobacteriaceae bacterium]